MMSPLKLPTVIINTSAGCEDLTMLLLAIDDSALPIKENPENGDPNGIRTRVITVKG